MKRFVAISGVIAFLSFLGTASLTACKKKEALDWQRAEQIGTIMSYEEFLLKYPKRKIASEAKRKIKGQVKKLIDLEVDRKLGYWMGQLFPGEGESIRYYRPDTKTKYLQTLDEAMAVFTKDEWETLDPGIVLEKQSPKIEFRNGEVRITKRRKIYIKKGTQAKIENRIYVFFNGEWINTTWQKDN